jgi:hypothetical protein
MIHSDREEWFVSENRLMMCCFYKCVEGREESDMWHTSLDLSLLWWAKAFYEFIKKALGFLWIISHNNPITILWDVVLPPCFVAFCFSSIHFGTIFNFKKRVCYTKTCLHRKCPIINNILMCPHAISIVSQLQP